MKLFFVIGTRPEAIKLAPLVLEARARKDYFKSVVCVTGQHKDLLSPVLTAFGVKPDVAIKPARVPGSLVDVSARILKRLGELISSFRPDAVVVQGDTTSALMGALAGFYGKIPVVHVEAGLRSRDRRSPFPEETNRVLIDQLSDFLFAPTQPALDNLNREGMAGRCWIVGNTGIDALLRTAEREKLRAEYYRRLFPSLSGNAQCVLITLHRRENFGAPIQEVLEGIRRAAAVTPETRYIYPVHPNPAASGPAKAILSKVPNVHLIQAQPYPVFVWLMMRATFILTDSGGIQEEAPTLGKPVLIARANTERQEVAELGTSRLIGLTADEVEREITGLLGDEMMLRRMSKPSRVYGEGRSSHAILDILRESFDRGEKRVTAAPRPLVGKKG